MEHQNVPAMVTVYEPVEKPIQDITEDDLRRLDRVGAISLARQLKKALIDIQQQSSSVQLDVLDEAVAKTSTVNKFAEKKRVPTNIGDLPIAVDEKAVISILGFSKPNKNRMYISLKSEDYLVRVPRNYSWKDVGIEVGDSFKVTVAGVKSESAPFQLKFLERLQDYTKSILQKEPEVATEAFKNITRNKKTQTHNRWTPELRAELKRVALTGKHTDDIYAESLKHGLKFTKYALMAQLNLMGFSRKNGIFTLRITEKQNSVKVQHDINNDDNIGANHE